jgi:hypothetical protein
MEELRSNLVFGLRMIRRSPGFAVVAILTLALGIGATSSDSSNQGSSSWKCHSGHSPAAFPTLRHGVLGHRGGDRR